jgi:phenylalanyl-tRNA synthetase beta chain
VKVVLSWLREFCPSDLPVDELADRLTMAGVKVEEILRPWDGLDGVTIARVVEVADHPDSDKLCVARVETGSGERTVCAGVRNMTAGDLVPYAPPGSRVPVLPEPLSAKKLRGVMSEGMLCSPRELNIADVHTGILVLEVGAPLGADFKLWLGLDDAVLEIEIEPNRPDLMSVIGVAREAAAVTGVPLHLPTPVLDEASERADAVATVEIRDSDRCPRYLARVVTGVAVGPSPLKVQARLTASGMRPLSNVVDATNYVLLEVGHPLHPFDLDKVEGEAIVVRLAEEGEHITTLDGVEHELKGEDLLISDWKKGVAVAGVMGCAPAEVSDATQDVLLESAYFERTGILRTARRLGFSTEASMRFERGTDPEAVPRAADRAAELMVRWSGGRVLRGYAEAGAPPERRVLSMRPERASQVLGFEVTPSDALRNFASIGVDAMEDQDEIAVTVPGYRVDLEREVDLIEEVARLGGYDKVGSSLPGVRQTGGVAATYALGRRVRELLVRAGMREVRSLSFASQADLDLTGDGDAVRVANPLVAEESFLRTRLTPGLLRALGRNLSRQVRSAALFEVATVFRPASPVEERQKVAFAMTGPFDTGWTGDGRILDFYDAKGVLESLLEGLGVEGWTLGEPLSGLFHPTRSARVLVDGAPAGVVGELHPRVARSLDLGAHPVAFAELEMNLLSSSAATGVTFLEIPRFPPARRDLAFVLGADIPAKEVLAALVEAAAGLAEEAKVFDVFSGDPIPSGKKSVAFSVDFRVPGRTLTDAETDEAVRAISSRLAADFGAELRSV